MENKLTIQDIQELSEKLNREREDEVMGCKFIKTSFLHDSQTIIKSGENIYYSPDITNGDIKVVTIPEPKFYDSLSIRLDFEDEFPQYIKKPIT